MDQNITIIAVGCETVDFFPCRSLARAELGIIPEDRELIQSLFLKISQFLFSQAPELRLPCPVSVDSLLFVRLVSRIRITPA